MHLEIPGPPGTLEALLDQPAGTPRAAVVFAHPLPSHGGTMHTKAVFQGSKGLVRIGCVALRFNFRGVGASAGEAMTRERAPSPADGDASGAPGEMADYQAALDFMAARFPSLPLWAAGFSFGSWVALETGAVDPRVSALIGIAPPVSGRGYAFPNTLASTKPKFFVQGDLDQLCRLPDMWAFYGKLQEPKELAIIDGANHLFEGKTREVGEALEDLLGDFA